MFLRCYRRFKDGKEHRYWSVVENRRLQSGRIAQRQVVYLGEMNDSQRAAWRKGLEVFDEQQQQYTVLSLFAEDRPAPTDLNAIQVQLDQMELRRAAVRQLLAGMRTVAAIGAGPVLGTKVAAWP